MARVFVKLEQALWIKRRLFDGLDLLFGVVLAQTGFPYL